MKIAIVSFEYYPENVGVGNAATNLATGLHMMGHEVTVFAPRKLKLHKKQSTIHGVSVNRIGRDNKTKIPFIGQFISFLFIFQTTKRLRKLNPDIILGEGWNHQSGVVSGYAGRRLKIMSLMRAHATIQAFEKSFKGIRRWLFDKAFFWNDIILTTNKKSKSDILEKYGRTAEILPNCYLTTDPPLKEYRDEIKIIFEKEGRIKTDKLNLLAVGRLEKIKGFEYLVNAMKDLPYCNLNIIGKGILELELQKLKERLKINNVNFVGFIENKEVKDYMIASDLLVMPSILEGLSMTIIEAMANLLPIISTLNDGTKDLIQHGINGYIISTESSESIVEAINFLRKDNDMMTKLANNANNTLKEYCSVNAVEKKLIKIIEEFKKRNEN